MRATMAPWTSDSTAACLPRHGATRGLGQATAKALCAEGAKVVVSSRGRERVVEAAVAERSGATRAAASSPTTLTPRRPERLDRGRVLDPFGGSTAGSSVWEDRPGGRGAGQAPRCSGRQPSSRCSSEAVALADGGCGAARRRWFDRLRTVDVGEAADQRSGDLERPYDRDSRWWRSLSPTSWVHAASGSTASCRVASTPSGFESSTV